MLNYKSAVIFLGFQVDKTKYQIVSVECKDNEGPKTVRSLGDQSERSR